MRILEEKYQLMLNVHFPFPGLFPENGITKIQRNYTYRNIKFSREMRDEIVFLVLRQFKVDTSFSIKVG